MNRIEDYSFGRMVIDGREFTSDLIIHVDGRIQDGWWRREGHRLSPEDIGPLLQDSAPGRLIIGTGNSGLMAVSEEVMNICHGRGIGVDILPTSDAAQRFNRSVEEGAVVAACFHLTC